MNYWILQVNPDKFDILRWLGDFKWCHDRSLVDCWHISRYAKEVEPGDTVFVWKSKGKSDIRGIYAKGKIEPCPQRFPLADEERSYFVGKAGKTEMERLGNLPEIAVRYTGLHVDRPLLSNALEDIPELRGLTVLGKGQAHRRGIHRLAREQGRILEALLVSGKYLG